MCMLIVIIAVCRIPFVASYSSVGVVECLAALVDVMY